MEAILLIIKYLFKKKNIGNDDESIDEFFENGISFPHFISLIFDVETIPNIIQNPQTNSDISSNNSNCLRFLYQKNSILKKMHLTLKNEDDRTNLLLFLLTEYCFHSSIDEIKSICNLIVQPLNIIFQKETDIISIKCLLSVLNVFTDGKVQIIDESDEEKNFDQILTSCFEQAKVPLVINTNCIDLEHQNLFLIQLEIIFEIFSEKIYEIRDKNENWYKIKEDELDEESDSDIIYAKIQENSLLKTLNVIGKDKFHFNCFHDAILNDSIPRFVMHLLHIDSIENVHLKTSYSNTKLSQKITRDELNNIKSVIAFLKTKEIKFQLLKFDFEDPSLERNSTYLFYSNLLNYFFIKKSKKEMYDRCGVILCTKRTFKEYDTYYQLLYFRTYSALISFYINKNLDFYFPSLPNDEDEAGKLFNKAKIPKVINEDILQNGIGENISDAVYYQLQIIFDAIDSGPACLHIIETFLYAIYNLKKISVLNFDLIAGSIRAKRVSLEFQKKRYDHYLHRANANDASEENFNDDTDNIDEENSNKLITFQDRQLESNKENLNSQKNNEQKSDANKLEYSSSFEQFWNFKDPNFGYENGIVYNKLKTSTKLQQNWINQMKYIQSKITKSQINEINDENNLISFRKSNSSVKSILYKFFYYDDVNNEWKFNSDIFKKFLSDKNILFEESSTPLVVVLNSNENDSISLVSNLINGLYPDFESESNDQQIFVYALCDKTLSMLNFHIDFADKIKSSIKPIFLLLHIPKSKENLFNLQQIIFEIYLFLSFISDLQIIILDKNQYICQTDLMECFNEIYLSFLNKKKYQKLFDSTKNDEKEEEEEEKNDDEYEYENDFWKDSSNINDNTNKFENNYIISKIVLKQPKIIFLVNDSTIQCNQKNEFNLIENEFFHNLISKINCISCIRYINVEDSNTYEEFLSVLNDLLIKGSSNLSLIKNNFQCVKLFKLSQMYVRLRNKKNDWKNDLYNLIINRKSELESHSKIKYSFMLISNLRNELFQIIPLFDTVFINESNRILSELKLKNNKENRDFYSSELSKSSESHLSFIMNKLEKKDFLTEEQMDLIIRTHINFLKGEFFDIIRLSNNGENLNIIYEDNTDILENQIEKARIEFEKRFNRFIENINFKKSIKEQYVREKMKMSTNYAMRETENLKEIKVTVEVDGDLKDEIEQDF